MDLMVTLGEVRDTMTVDLKCLVVPNKNVYNCILERPFTTTLGIVASLVHMKMKYHNIHDEPVTICVNLYEALKIDKALYHRQKTTLVMRDKGKH